MRGTAIATLDMQETELAVFALLWLLEDLGPAVTKMEGATRIAWEARLAGTRVLHGRLLEQETAARRKVTRGSKRHAR
jgi:hypothetical protein